MSALDQAIIKAYAKDRPRPAAPVAPPAHAKPRPLPATGSGSQRALERLYHEGSLYRVEQATVAAPGRQSLPAPHLPVLPPTSPRRSVRRSMLRLLAASSETTASPPSTETPRVARKVIFRHISHPAAPPPLGLLRPTATPTAEHSQPVIDDLPDFTADLPPETIADEPESTPIPTAPPAPAAPLAPSVPSLPLPAMPAAPLNIALDSIPQFEIRGEWRAEECLAPQMLLAELPAATHDLAGAVFTVHLDGLAAAEAEACATHEVQWHVAEADELPTPAPTFQSKSLDDRPEPRIEFRVDKAHAFGRHRPHAKFEAAEQPAVTEPTEQEVAEITDDELTLAAPVVPVVELELPPAASELTIADALEEPLASELTLVEEAAEPDLVATAPIAPAEEEAIKPAASLWEVDKFHWPRTCEKLFADEQGYLSRAGDKLLAAVQDGLRVLAITGSRRGEGRSTVALCLARAAARAGIQTAVMDADFARPQLASKVALDVAYGWQDAALGHIPLSEAAIKSLADNITLLPLESSAAARGLSLADPRVTATIRAAAATFELLILDLGPMATSEQIRFPAGEACPLDAAIVVRDLRFATATESETVGHALQDAGVEAVGIAENFVIEEEVPNTSV